MIEYDSFKECGSICDNGVVLYCYIQPKASRNAVIAVHDKALKIALTAPPLDGKANAALLKFLSKKLNLAKSSIVIKRGTASRRKTLLIIANLKLQEIYQRLI